MRLTRLQGIAGVDVRTQLNNTCNQRDPEAQALLARHFSFTAFGRAYAFNGNQKPGHLRLRAHDRASDLPERADGGRAVLADSANFEHGGAAAGPLGRAARSGLCLGRSAILHAGRAPCFRRNSGLLDPLPDACFRVVKQAFSDGCFATIATVAERLLKIAIDRTLQAPSVIDDATCVA